MIHASLFSGIGGPEVAAAMLGWENAFHCEINPFGKAVLEYWFPNSTSYDDITKTDFKEWRGRVDVLTGGFPCQPFSYAGKRGGRNDDRYLWPEMLRVIDEVRPAWVVGENVAGITTMVEGGVLADMGCDPVMFGEGDGLHRYQLRERFTIERICADLEGLGYTVQPVLIPAAAVGAPHRRDRVFIVAHRNTDHVDGRLSFSAVSWEQKPESLGSGTRIQHGERFNLPRTITDASDLLGDGCCAGYEREPGGRQVSEFGNGRGEDAAADTADLGLQRTAQPGTKEEICGEMGGEGNHTQRVVSAAADGIRRPVADALCGDGQGEQQVERELARRDGTDGDGCKWDAAHAVDERLERDGGSQLQRDKRGETTHEHTPCGSGVQGLDPRERWGSFPTVSPVHRGNDGLPFSLDDLTISATKWRTESLKAYGNAIVPQVMYRIFQAIEQCSEKI